MGNLEEVVGGIISCPVASVLYREGKEEGRRKKEEGRKKKEEGRRKNLTNGSSFPNFYTNDIALGARE